MKFKEIFEGNNSAYGQLILSGATNDKGTWFGWSVEKVGPVQDKGLYEQAKSFAVSANKGDVTAKHGEEDTKSKQDSVPF